MMRKEQCAGGLLALLLVIGTVEAQAQTIREFPCQIDLGEREEGGFRIDGILPPEFRNSYGADRKQKVCQGRNVRVSCEAFIKDWPFQGNFVASDLTCCINTAQCGIANSPEVGPCGSLSVAETASLRITSTRSSLCGPDSTSCGFARLECRLN